MEKMIVFLTVFCCFVSSAVFADEVDPNTYADKFPTIPKNARIAILPMASDFPAVPQEIPIIQDVIVSQIKDLGLTPFIFKFDAASTPKSTIQLFMLPNSSFKDAKEARSAKQEFITGLKGQANYDILFIPAVVSRTAKLNGQSAYWDNVRAGLTIKGFGSGQSSEWSGSRLGLSLELDAYDVNGNWMFTSYGGISIPYVINTREAVNELKPRLFETKKDQDTLQKGVEAALKPLTKKIKISKELSSAASPEPGTNEVILNVEPTNDAAQLEEAMRYYRGTGVAKDYKKAVQLLTKSSEQGNVIAQATLGYIYLKGEGVPQDHNLAITWLGKAAEQDDTEAQRNLGALYFGDGVLGDIKKAQFWFTKAAEKGDLFAQHNLGVLYARIKDPQKAAFWFSKAANLGNPNAQLSLGRMYSVGEGVPQDNKQAYIWAALAATKGMNPRIRDTAASKLSPQVLAQAQKEAKELFEKIEANQPKK
jgi:TPR repeat protein